METSGGRGPRSTSVLSPVLGHSRFMPISASQCQFEMAGSYLIIEDYFPKWPLFTYGASERRLRLSNTSINIPADFKKKKKNLHVNLLLDILKRFFNFFIFAFAAVQGASGGLWSVLNLQRVSWFRRSPLRLVCPAQHVSKIFFFCKPY